MVATKADAIEKRIRAMHPLDFEELCADLVTELGFINVRRQGSGTQFGRDIAAEFVASRMESWFFECKRYASTIPLKEVSNKLLWADSQETLDYFVIASNAELNNDFRQLVNLSSRRQFRILTWTGVTFRRLLAACPRTVSSWFGGLSIGEQITAVDFLREQRGAEIDSASSSAALDNETIMITVGRSGRTPGADPCYVVITDYNGHKIASIALKRGRRVQLKLPKGALGKPVHITYDFEPHAYSARHYPRDENLLLVSELSIPSEYLKTRVRAVARVPMARWRQYTGAFCREQE
jgi:hypothetical protein